MYSSCIHLEFKVSLKLYKFNHTQEKSSSESCYPRVNNYQHFAIIASVFRQGDAEVMFFLNSGIMSLTQTLCACQIRGTFSLQ